MKPIITPELLQKYLDGECSPQELFLVNYWYDSFEGNQEPLAGLDANEQEILRTRILNNVKTSLANNIQSEIAPRKLFVLKWWFAGAAAAAVLTCILLFGTLKKAPIVANVSYDSIVLSNRTDAIHRQQLSDGSIVWLNPKSSLEYPKKFTGLFREVKMDGEAFFEVRKDHKHPFIIYSGGVVTRVWGTSFRIRAYQHIPTEVSVVTGKVSVKIPKKENSEVILLPQQTVVYQTLGALLKKSNGLNSSMKRWQKTTLSFDNIPLQTVFNRLNSHYGVRIYTSDNQLGRYLLKADFTDQSLPAILDMIANSLNVNYVLDNDEIVIYKKAALN
jgi:transmembrane sensor